MAPATSPTRTFGLLAVLLLAASNSNNGPLFARAQQDSTTTGGAPDAGTSSSYYGCGGTPAPAGPLAPGETPAPTNSVRCLPDGWLDDSSTLTAAPSEAAATPEPTAVADSTGDVPTPDTPTPAPSTPAPTTEATGGADGNRDVVITPAPSMMPTTAEEDGDEMEEDPAAGTGADAVPTPAPTNEDGQTADEAAAEGDTTDGAFGRAPRSSGVAALAASCGLLLAAGILAL